MDVRHVVTALRGESVFTACYGAEARGSAAAARRCVLLQLQLRWLGGFCPGIRI